MDYFCGMNYVHTMRDGVNWLVTQFNYLSNKLRELVIKLILPNTHLFPGFFQKKILYRTQKQTQNSTHTFVLKSWAHFVWYLKEKE